MSLCREIPDPQQQTSYHYDASIEYLPASKGGIMRVAISFDVNDQAITTC